MDRTQIEDALSALGELLADSEAPPASLVVCGGASLIVNRWVPRSTQDVDVLAFCESAHPDQSDLRRCEKLPEYLEKAVSKVASEFGLGPEWLNIGPSGLVQLGLPDGLMARAIRRDYGRALSVFYISRFDQVHFKLYAAIDGSERHLQDLKKLKPTEEEIESAKAWVEKTLHGGFLPADMATVMENLGYGHLLE